MAGLTAMKDDLAHEMGMHTEGLRGRNQQRFFDVTEESNGYRYPDAPDVDFNRRVEIDCEKLETPEVNARLRELAFDWKIPIERGIADYVRWFKDCLR